MYKKTIPNYPENFAGRARELKRLSEYIDLQKIMIIAGITGIGKTSLLLRFCHQIMETDPEHKVIWIDCQNDWNSESFFEHMISWMSDRGVDTADLVQKSTDDIKLKIKSIISLMEKNGIYAFVDNFHLVEDDNTCELIRMAIRFFKEARLVISTQKRVKLSPLDRVDVFERRLDGFSFDDTKIFLGNLLTKHGYDLPEEQVLKNIYGRIHGHPFSVKLLVSLYITGDISLHELISESSEFGEELENYILETLYRSLSAKEKSFLKEFSVFNIPVSQQVIEELISIDDFGTVKTKLVELYLLDRTTEKKYLIHSILKDYCRSRLKPSEKTSLYNRFAEYFAKFDEINYKLQAFYYWFDTKDKDKAIQFLGTFIDEMFRKGRNEELFNIIEKVLENFNEGYPIIKYFKANILLRWGRINETIDILDSMLEEAYENRLKARVYETFGRAYSLLSENEAAIDYFSKAYDMFSELDDIEGMVACLIGKGDSLRFIHHYSEAAEYFNTAKEHINKVSIELKGRIYKGLGDVDFGLRNYNRAHTYYMKSIDLFDSIKENFHIGKIKHNLAFLYFEMEETEKCLETLRETLQYREDINDTVGMVYNYSFIGEIYLMKWDLENAEYYLDKGIDCIVEHDEIRGQLDLYLNAIRLNIIKKEYDSAELLINEAMELLADSEGYEHLMAMLYITSFQLEYCSGVEVDIEELDNTLKTLVDYREFNWALQGLLVKRNQCYKLNTAFTENETLEEYLDKTAEIEREFFLKWFELKTESRKIYNVIINGEEQECDISEYNELLQNADEYDLFVDLSQNRIIEKDRGELKVLKKRTVGNVFIYFLNNAGKELSFREIFESIWKREYDPETDAITVRVNISRLRGAVEAEPKKPKYIINAKESGYYLFNPKVKYTVIRKN